MELEGSWGLDVVRTRLLRLNAKKETVQFFLDGAPLVCREVH